MKNRLPHTEAFIAQLKNVEHQLSQNRLREAALQLNQLAKISPNDPRVFLIGSRLAEAAGNPDGMLQAAKKAHSLEPTWPPAAIYLAGVLTSRNETRDALALAIHAVQHATVQGSLDAELLTAAASISHRQGLHEQTLTWLRHAEKMSPNDAGIQYKIGLTLNAMGDFTPAIEIFTALLSHTLDKSAILSARRQSALGARQLALAIQDGEALLALDPANQENQYYLAVALGKTPPTQPASVVSSLFDALASQFDRQLLVHSQYALPSDVAQMIRQWHPDNKVDVLDLGCGTGLLGRFLGSTEGVLVGVDLSEKMIEQAHMQGVYSSFHQVNVLDALAATPENLYHVIAALDVLIYVGNLDTVVINAHRILLPGGRFVFSCEASSMDNGADYTLQPSYRYTHQRCYVERLLAEAGFENNVIEDCVLRLEAGQPVSGFLVTAQKFTLQDQLQVPVEQKTARRPPKNAKQAPLAQ